MSDSNDVETVETESEMVTEVSVADGAELIRQHSPFNEIESDQVIDDAAKKGVMEAVPEGNMIFKRGGHDEYSYWIVEGSIDLLDENFDVVAIHAKTGAAVAAIDNETPHTLTAVCTSDSVVFKLKSSYLELVMKLQASDNYMVSNLDEIHESESDWMSSMLSSPLFDFVPPANIQELFSKFEEVECTKGEVVIKQGEVGDYFYVIQSGRAAVEYNTGARSITLAELEPGAFFGEDALISNVPRNATITMLSDGMVMRLSEDDFHSLLHAPLIEKVSLEEAHEMMEAADPLTWILDVRTKFEFQGEKMEDSINVPLLSLRKDFSKLDQESVYIARSAGDKRCELAAYILNGNGYTSYVLSES